MLLHFKVNVGLTNHKRELPIHRVCISDKNIEVWGNHPQLSHPWITPVCYIQALLYLVELCPDIDVRDGDGWTPLMYAAKSGSSAIVKYLIQRGANPNLRQVCHIPIPSSSHTVMFPFPQSAGFSALYLASQEGHACICCLLLEVGADPNLSGGSQDLGPLHIAAHRYTHTTS